VRRPSSLFFPALTPCHAVSFLWADPTPDALQVFLPQPHVAAASVEAVPSAQGGEQGVWISADPRPGCVVCNIGTSASPAPRIHERRADALYQ